MSRGKRDGWVLAAGHLGIRAEAWRVADKQEPDQSNSRIWSLGVWDREVQAHGPGRALCKGLGPFWVQLHVQAAALDVRAMQPMSQRQVQSGHLAWEAGP